MTDKNLQDDQKFIDAKIAKNGIGKYRRHILLCMGPSCCTEEKGVAVWEHLKKTLREKDPLQEIYRTKVGCLRVCKSGPIALVYPEGTWYRDVDEANCDRIVDDHLLNGVPVSELIIAENPLPKEK